MAKIAVRLLLLLVIVAIGRAAFREFFQDAKQAEVQVIYLPAGDCAAQVPAPDGSEGN